MMARDGTLADLGLLIKSGFPNPESHIQIVESFLILNLVMFSNGTSSITAKIDGKIASFDFDDEVLKVFVHVLKRLDLIDRAEVEACFKNQDGEPVVFDFLNGKALVVGMVLDCQLGEVSKSTKTGEEFVPLNILSTTIVQEPAATLVKQAEIICTN